MFEQACNERIQQFDDDDSDEDIWVEKPLTFDRNAKQTRSGLVFSCYFFFLFNELSC